MGICKKCGSKIKEGSNFCAYCGEPVMNGTEKAFENEQKQHGGQRNFFKKHGIFLTVIALCLIILASIPVNMYRKAAKEDLEPKKAEETASEETGYEEEETPLSEGAEDEESDESDNQEDNMEGNANEEEDIEGFNINGNTNMNLKNGGWVAEQGDWNYYLFWNSVLKENVETGEKQYLYGFQDADSMRLNSLHVMGEWIYFSAEGVENHIFELKTDGSGFQSLEAEWLNNVLAWGIWDGRVYVIVKEYSSVQSYTVYAAAVDWEYGTYEEVCKLFDSDDAFSMVFDEKRLSYHYIGMNDGYLYIYRRASAVMAYNLETGELTEYPCGWSFHVTDIYADDALLCGVGYCVKEGQKGDQFSIQRSLGFIDEDTYQECEYNEIALSEYDEINEINRTDEGLIVVGSSDDGISIFDPSDETISSVVPDIAENICIAHNKIYYQCDGRYCEINVDGSGWREISEGEFMSAEPIEENSVNAQPSSGYKDAYYKFLTENESGFTAEMGEFEKQNEESYQKSSAFLLVDLDQDGVPELVVQHPDAYKSDRLYVYTYKSGEVVQVKNVDGEEGENAYINMNSQADGLYSVSGCGQNHLHVVWSAENFGREDSIYIVKKGQLELYAESEEIEELDVYTHRIDGEEVESGAYNVFLEGCGGSLINLEFNTESNREKYLL